MRLMVLNDGKTYSHVAGCKVINVPDTLLENLGRGDVDEHDVAQQGTFLFEFAAAESVPAAEAEVTGGSLHDLMSAVRRHPDFVFGAVFTTGDFETGVPEAFNSKVAEDALVSAGNDVIQFG
jgi:hypothetical protein